MTTIHHIAAVATNRTIGRNGSIPWDLPHDRSRFKTLTMGGALVAGRKTAETLPKMKGRDLVVVGGGVSLEEAIAKASALSDHVWIIGGERIYRETIHLATDLFLTAVWGDYEGDAFYPVIPPEFRLYDHFADVFQFVPADMGFGVCSTPYPRGWRQ